MVTSVENDEEYLKFVKKKFKVDGTHFVLEPDRRYYPFVNGDHIPYDLIFVDGRMREACLRHSRLVGTANGVIVLHDAEREDYKKEINQFKYVFYTDNGNTVTLTNSDKTASRIKDIFSIEGII